MIIDPKAISEQMDTVNQFAQSLLKAAEAGERFCKVMEEIDAMSQQKVMLTVRKAAAEPTAPEEPVKEQKAKDPALKPEVRPAKTEAAPEVKERSKANGKLTPGDKKEVLQMYERGESIGTIAKEFGVAYPTVRYHLERAGVLRCQSLQEFYPSE